MTKVISLMEIQRGIGLVFGPIIGSITYEYLGFSGPNFLFGAIFTFYFLLVRIVLPEEVESKVKEEKLHESNIQIPLGYFDLFKNKFILFATIAIIVGMI